MKRAALALLCAASLVAFSGLSGCSNSSGGGAPFVPPNLGPGKADSANEAAALREAAGKKFDAMEGEWVFDRSFCSDVWENGISQGQGSKIWWSKDYSSATAADAVPVSLSFSGRVCYYNYKQGSLRNEWLQEIYAVGNERFYESYKNSFKSVIGFDLDPSDIYITDISRHFEVILKLNNGELFFVYPSQTDNTGAYMVFRKKGSSPSGGGSGSISFSLQGKWKKQGDTQNGRWIQIKNDGSFDFYKNGSLYNLYTDRTFAQSGSSVTVGYTASVLSVSDKFAVSGSASEMKWTLEKSSYVTGGQTYEDTTSSAALQALWDIMGSEVTLVPCN